LIILNTRINNQGVNMKKIIYFGLGMMAATFLNVSLAQPKQQQQLIVASFPSFDEATKAAIPLYKKLHPEITIKLISLSYTDHHNSLITSLITGAGLPDVVGLEVNYIGKFAESGGLENLATVPYSALVHKNKIVKYPFAQATSREGGLVAMPADLGPGSLFYRTDILTRAGVQESDLTTTWEGFIATGKTIKTKTGSFLVPNATTLSDVYIRSNIKDGDGIYFDKDDKVLINTPRFEKAFELAKAVRSQGLDAKVAPWTNEWNEGFKRGSFATEMSGAWLAGHLSNYIAPETKGKWRVAPLPNGAFASWGGSFYAIPKKISDEKKKLAWDFISFMTTTKSMQLAAFKQLDAYPALLEAAEDSFVNQPIEFLGGQKARQIWKNLAAKIPAIQVNKLDPIAAEIVATELDKVLEGGKDIKLALADAQKQVERRVRR
jgi:multiple sugar transport system substrate-binding protein